MTDNNNEFLKNADIRAGKVPGWPSKPATNGDPYDSKNMERTDAAMVVTDGLIMKNVASVHAAKIVGQRKLIATAISAIVFASLAYNLATKYNLIAPIGGVSGGPVVEAQYESAPEAESSEPGKTPDYVTAGQYIGKFYVSPTAGVAKKYDTKFFSKFGWPVKGYDWSINSYSWAKYTNQYKSGELKSVNDQVPAFCAGQTLSECLPKMNDEMAFAALAYAGENMEMYGPRADSFDDTQRMVPQLETALTDFNKAFAERKAALEKDGQKMANYCDSPNRLFADTWGVTQAGANLSIVQKAWEKDGKIPYNDHIVKVGSMKELINLREDGDKKCNNINIAVLPASAGALEYIMNVSVRTHNGNGDNIATGMYLLGKLDKGNVMSLVATNNSDNAPLLSQGTANSNLSSILPGLEKASSKIIDLFEDSGYSLVDKNKTNTNQGE